MLLDMTCYIYIYNMNFIIHMLVSILLYFKLMGMKVCFLYSCNEVVVNF